MTQFTVFPAIDLRAGKVVRLAQGDPQRQTVYGSDPAQVATQWQAAGATWIHVVNLDGALGDSGRASHRALTAILGTDVHVQFGGGVRTLSEVERVLTLGIRRLILGTAAAESPQLLQQAIARFGAERVGVGIDVRNEKVQVRGWTQDSGLEPLELTERLYKLGVRTVVHTDIARDGLGEGPQCGGLSIPCGYDRGSSHRIWRSGFLGRRSPGAPGRLARRHYRTCFVRRSVFLARGAAMLAKRIIPCLDVKDGRVVKGVNFVNLRDAGDPVEQARIYDQMGADEIVFLDISATPEGRQTTVEVVRKVADQVFLPLTCGRRPPHPVRYPICPARRRRQGQH